MIEKVNRRIIEDLQNVSREEQEELMAIYDLMGKEPHVKLALAFYREAMMFKEMTYAMLLRYDQKIKRLEHRIVELEDRKDIE